MKRGDVVDEIARLFGARGNSMYGGEGVTQLEHALQAAYLAETSGADAATISAALLHDVGHVLHNLPEDAPDQGIDDVHEELAYRWLTKYFGPAVAEPVRMHVDAKRYLCSAEPSYLDLLSPPSIQSLMLQGGPFTPEEAQDFAKHPQFEQAIMVRRWDDEAKVPGLETPTLQHFLGYVREVVVDKLPAEANA
ncbi:MAG: phosphonate degradation HD-domain oxygenase [Pirellulales bacterium]